MKQDVFSIENIKVGDIELSPSIFQLPVRVDILSRVIEWQLANRRAGTHKTKQIGDISGTTKKPHRQKGTGSARQGSKRSPQFRGGAVIFGPVVRTHGYNLPKKVRQLGLKTILSSKFQNNNLVIVDSFEIILPRTGILKNVLKSFNIQDALLISMNNTHLINTTLAASNMPCFDVIPQIGANVYDIMRKTKLIITVEAIKELEARLS